jgi:hypothetical protein
MNCPEYMSFHDLAELDLTCAPDYTENRGLFTHIENQVRARGPMSSAGIIDWLSDRLEEALQRHRSKTKQP